MQIVVEHRGRPVEVDVVIEDPAACVAEFVTAVDPGAGDAGWGLLIDGRFCRPDEGMDEVGLYEGARVQLAERPGTPITISRPPLLAIVAGPAAGRVVALHDGPVTIGRGSGSDVVVDDPTLSSLHTRIEAKPSGGAIVRDLGSRNGTWIDGVPASGDTNVPDGALVRLGATHARVITELPADLPLAVDPRANAHGGLVSFNRPPRPARPQPLEPIEAPEAPEDPGKGRPFSLIALAAPLIMGGALVTITGNIRFALFMLMSPMMLIGNWLSSRRQAKKQKKTGAKEYKEALAQLEVDLEAAVRAERRRRIKALPDPAECARRASNPSTTLWERRSDHEDFLHLHVGIGDVPWDPPVEGDDHPEEVVQQLHAHGVLERCPVSLELAGSVLGIVGDRAGALPLARSLITQAAIHHGPADLTLVVLSHEDHARSWDWLKWLPHSRDSQGASRFLSTDHETSDRMLASLTAAPDEDEARQIRLRGDDAPTGPHRLVLIDDMRLLQGRRAPARLLLRGQAGPVAGIVIAPTEDQLPSMVDTVIRVHSEAGDADLRRPQEGTQIDGFVTSGMTDADSREVARHLARYEDPELQVVGAGVPSMVRLLPLLGMEDIDAEQVLTAWKEDMPDPGPNAPLGIGEDGALHLDLHKDGPHGLVGGTTGSGKSELLRSMVAGMAARVDPEHLVFVLVDYKGGSAFDECAKLPHTVGMVTDLDEHLGERALVSLEAELHHRERLLRDAGAADLPEYLKAGASLGPLPRMVVVIDEFATLAAELPDFLDALVGIAQRGRSLGVHMILATQRPSGAVNANIKANTNLRIALRVQDTADSMDIIDKKDAAKISRSNPGRAYVRLGPSDVALIQSALSTAPSEDGPGTGIRFAPFIYGPLPTMPLPRGSDSDGPTDLQRLVTTITEAFISTGMEPPRKPWLEMLPEHLPLSEIAVTDDQSRIAFALADDPEHQTQRPTGWAPEAGHLAIFGAVGSGTTTALSAVAMAAAMQRSPDQLHLYALDFGAGGLSALADLAHCGGVIAASQREAQFRLIRMLKAELDRRRDLDLPALRDEPLIVVAIDGVGAFLSEHDGVESQDLADNFKRVFNEGASVRICCVVAAERPGALPMRLSGGVSQKLLLRLADPTDFSAIGVRPNKLPAFVPGRGMDADSKRVVQVGDPGDLTQAVAALADRWAPPANPAPTVATLPTELYDSALEAGADLSGDPIHLTVGLAEDDLEPMRLPLHVGEHALIVGPPRSGKSSMLVVLARQIRAAAADAVLVGVCTSRSPLNGMSELDGVGSLEFLHNILLAGVSAEQQWFVLVDDAGGVDDSAGALGALVRAKRPGLHVIAAVRTDEAKAGYGHWTRDVRGARTGVLLQPDLSNDGDIFGVRLPRQVHVSLGAGRGFAVVAGDPALAQMAMPDDR